MRSAIALAWTVVVLGLVGFSITAKERQLESGRLVLLEIAPVDPRSLMQGDYMALRFVIARDARPQMEPGARARSGLATADGHIVARLGPDAIASFERLDDGSPLAEDEVLLRYRVREGQLKFATNAFFFEEGTGDRYARARYGEFRVAPDGEMLLAQLRDEALEPL